jgi:hypothetical protein
VARLSVAKKTVTDEEVTYQQITLVAKGFSRNLNSVLIYLLIHRKRSPFPAGEG